MQNLNQFRLGHPRFRQFGCFYFEFSLVLYSSLYSVGDDWSPPFPPENRVIRHPEKPPLAIKNDWSIIQTNALNSMNLHKHYIPISLWATLRSPHRITGFLLSSSLRYSLKSLSQPWRYSSLNTNQSSFQLNVEKQNQINPSSQSEQRFISSLANENSKWTKWKNGNCLKRGKTRATKSRLFPALHLIGWEDGVSFLNQSQNKIQYLQSKPDHYRDSIKIPFNVVVLPNKFVSFFCPLLKTTVMSNRPASQFKFYSLTMIFFSL